ncbi:GspH/FimT family pseudopilin [Ectothiorhodospira sp. BSL-9]|uniref:GspH/FimT family pseudopilin n=1 Tax=Ectothiorhodospira sp. BSL-9 TaxID=1442136 RepID=UPI0007B43369|nr:GspH/FimT family pseudopilin [Ectothiorhodospira sp. BSL-9]ANB01445.1 pilus assembly protein [Ectothiorhodospira sp. BSL-9]
MKTRGFTLVELMITLAVAAILATIAVPGFMNLIQTNRVVTQTNELVSAFNLARSEAIRRGVPVTVAASTGDDFASGWCVHLGNACDGDDRLRAYPGMSNMAVGVSGGQPIVFNGRGVKESPAGTVTLIIKPSGCAAGTTGRSRTLEIINTGRVSVTQGDC